MDTNTIRRTFLEYFAQHQHRVVPSSSLVPDNDPTLLFTNSGMVQFKDFFLGKVRSDFVRATSCQKCMRAGGKHNDLENVGRTARHHTFFEMLGNFSFGDYFKRDAIRFAWNFLTQVLKLSPERLWVTVHEDDGESEAIWLEEMQIDRHRFSRCREDNFWAMGDTGPCGPCTEIFYDHGPEVAGGPPGSPDSEGDRYVEIWNLVFMQYERFADGRLEPLPRPAVDTGMGLERIAAVMQGVHSNYEIDVFVHLLRAIATIAKTSDLQQVSLRVIADHIRSSVFLIQDGVVPSHEGRGYVLRRIIRRALRHGFKLGIPLPFFYRLVTPLVETMQAAYPELATDQARIQAVLEREELQFAKTLEQGMRLLEGELAGHERRPLAGEIAFKLYDTYGFPIDLTVDIAAERGCQVDMAGFEVAMAQQRERARQSSQFASQYDRLAVADHETEFVGYEHDSRQSTVLAMFRDGASVKRLEAGDAGQVILQQTPFYAESGGQVGDVGFIYQGNNRFRVRDTRRQGQTIFHDGVMETGHLVEGASVTAEFDREARLATMRNHSATHLLQAVLRQQLGTHVQQKGSLVDPKRLRFDFTHTQALTPAQLEAIESQVNQLVLDNTPVEVALMNLDEALQAGALALFEDKYREAVRVLKMADGLSVELCGGTHVQRTGDIGLFKVLSESGVAAGVRRIEAVTGREALEWVRRTEQRLQRVAQLLKAPAEAVEERLEHHLTQMQQLEGVLKQRDRQSRQAQETALLGRMQSIGDVQLLVAQLEGLDIKALREMADTIRHKQDQGVVVLASQLDGKAHCIVGVTKALSARVNAAELARQLAVEMGGSGGGRPDMAQAGTTHLERVEAALQRVSGWITSLLQL